MQTLFFIVLKGEPLSVHLNTLIYFVAIMFKGEKPFHCKLCDYRCAQNSMLTMHMRTHSKEANYACDMCDRRFKVCDFQKHQAHFNFAVCSRPDPLRGHEQIFS